ncbi:SDR family NAD(P)-dependent oxidoreductase [Sediminicola luteus]|uniref:Short-chain dehydrogenase n=1 Tax=Sediminicola luteus TaxID=319238 RepID=A0A2A4G9C8_9FLAO|nr:SDR family oxidoreductase [Sediminicola luteus]PCE64580.1 short-chain dehydrogenase [Sediminicola luteus]
MAKIIVTGTSRGIGYELCALLLEAGHEVLALSRKVAHMPKHKNLTALSFDLAEKTDYQKLDVLLQAWGKVDALVHNAGRLLNAPFMETEWDDFEKVYEVNVFGVMRLTQKVLPYMQKGGHVLTVTSMGGIQGSAKFAGLSAYSSSKGAVITLTELWAEEFKENGPAFNALALGAVQTEMLQEAFPGYQAPLSAAEMAEYIMDFTLTGQRYYNGKTLQVSSSTP